MLSPLDVIVAQIIDPVRVRRLTKGRNRGEPDAVKPRRFLTCVVVAGKRQSHLSAVRDLPAQDLAITVRVGLALVVRRPHQIVLNMNLRRRVSTGQRLLKALSLGADPLRYVVRSFGIQEGNAAHPLDDLVKSEWFENIVKQLRVVVVTIDDHAWAGDWRQRIGDKLKVLHRLALKECIVHAV